MKVSKIALAISLALAATEALAQGGYQQPQAPAQQPQQVDEQRQPRRGNQRQQQPAAAPAQTLTREEGAAINPLLTATRATPPDWAAAAAALPAAQAGAASPYARYVVGQLQLQIGRGTSNQAMQVQAVDAMIASGGAPATALPTLLAGRASFAIQASDWAGAETALTRFLEINPNDGERLRQLAEVKIRLNKNNEALALYQRLLAAAEAAGTPVSEENLRRTLELTIDQRQADQIAPLNQRLLRTYPTTENWRTALVRFRQNTGETDAGLALDVRRLMRVAGAFARAGDYVEFAGRLARAGQPGEAKAVLDDGIARGTVNAADPDVRQMQTTSAGRITEDRAALPVLRTRALAAATGREARIAGDTYFGYGQYPQAIELYRASMQKGGEDANLLNTRIGMSHAAAGQTAEAQTALRAVTGPRTALAAYWLLWLEHPATAAAPRPAATPPAQPTGN